MEKTYLPTAIQEKWNRRWQEQHCFEAKNDGRPTFTVFMPPPNVTGILHMGHILNNTIQDVLCRRARICEKDVLWLPGTDHAGIATQSKVEKVLKKEEGVTRHQLGREAFLQRVEQWRERHGHIICDQLKQLGVSCDWSRATYTRDPDYSRRVLEAFVKLYERGYIYRGKRLVNWCPVSQTALSDEEVIMKPTKGFLYTFLYEIVEQPNTFISVATTRPETIPGDVALAVHPNDPRYRAFIGLHARCPFDKKRTIPVIADEAVEQDFGTGALKITPAHDPVDFEVGKRHNLPFIEVLDASGKINANGSPFDGMDRAKARKAVIEALREKGLIVKEESYEHNVGYSERADVPIEPRLSEQWFLRYPQTEAAKRLAKEQLVRFFPQHWEKVYQHWLDHLQDWCISRQLWWGHRIPVWYRKDDPSKLHVSIEPPTDSESWVQDPDVLDTWFSSWLWPIGTLHYKDPLYRDLFDRHFPSDVLVSGSDILFFWITRMILASLEFVDDRPLERRIPFKHVYLTGIVRDAKGRKMSKSLGNSPDPLDLIQTYGADGVRIGLLSIAPQGQDIRFDEHALLSGRNFCTKLWNACRFRLMQGRAVEYRTLDDYFDAISTITPFDGYLLHALYSVAEAYERHLERYEFNAAVKDLQTCFRDVFCDFYLEVQKHQAQPCLAVQDLFLRYMLQMLHPFVPYITEELWEQMHFGSEMIHESTWNLSAFKQHLEKLDFPEKELSGIGRLCGLIGQLRALKAEHGNGNKSVVMHVLLEKNYEADFANHCELLVRLIGLKELKITQQPLADFPRTVAYYGTFFIETEVSDSTVSLNETQLRKQIDTLLQHIQTAEKKLSNEKFLAHAAPNVVEGVKRQLEENRRKYEALKELTL